MKEGDGNDHLAIAWEYPDQPLEVIPAKFSRKDSPCAMNLYCGTILNTWTDISGDSIANLMFATNYLTSEPNQSTRLTNVLESPTNIGDNYVSQMVGLLLPPVTGTYSFWIAADDNGEFWLSTDSDRVNKVLVCWLNESVSQHDFTNSTTQKSELVTLVAGQTYYYEVRQ